MSTTRIALFTVATALGAVAVAAPAGAHVEPDVTEVPAGSEATLAFEVEHGCDDSPTVLLEMQVPASVSDVEPVAKPGWNASVDDRVVTFEWGGAGGEQGGEFAITFTAPTTEGETLRFPTIQTCAEGAVDWIEDGEDAEHPAPAVVVVKGEAPPATTDTTAAEPTDSTGPTTTTTTAPDAGPAGSTAASPPNDDDEGTGLLIPLAIGVVIVGAGTYALIRRSRSRQP